MSTAETLDLLDRLRRAVRDITSRANELKRDFATRSTRLRAQFEQAIASERLRWNTETETEKTAAAAARERTEAAFRTREARIATARENTRKRRLAEIEDSEGKRTVATQHGLLDADRARDAEHQRNQAKHDAFLARLADAHARLEQLEAGARSVLGGQRALTANAPTSANETLDENQLAEQLHQRLETAERELSGARQLVLPVLFRFFPLWARVLVILLGAFVFVPELRRFDFHAVSPTAWAVTAGCFVGVVALYLLARALAAPRTKAVATALHQVRQLHEICGRKAEATFAREAERIRQSHAAATQKLNQEWKQTVAEAKTARITLAQRLEEETRKLIVASEERRRRRLARIEESHAEQTKRLHEESAQRTKQLEANYADNAAKLQAARDAGLAAVESDWRTMVLPLYQRLQTAAAAANTAFPPWRDELWQSFTLPDESAQAARFAELAVDLEKFCEVALQEQPLALAGPSQLSLPLLLAVPEQASILIETKQSGQTQVIGALNNLVLRLLTSTPPGRLAFTIFDPVGLGQNFAGIMHLADFEERLINSRIWTQQAQFEQRLADLNEHIEKVTQMYLRNEYQSLAEYNAQAGRLAEKYHFLVIADFPTNFSDVAVKRLQSIAASGPRCGVHLLIHWDQRKPAPVEFVPEELRKNAICVVSKGDGFAIANANWDGTRLTLDAPPAPELETRLLQQIGKESTDSYRVEMPFVEVAPDEKEMWSLETTNELRVPIGRTGATKLQYLALGQGTRQHGLVAGKTGSGKSTLFHVLITNLSLWCSPDQVEFYLVDFKKGVEFKCYATHKLPHARVVAIESDREFGLSVLQRVDEELKRRGDLFRKLGAQDIAGYKRTVNGSGTGVPPVQPTDHEHRQAACPTTEPMPRVLLLIDEFQELFVEDDRVSQGAALLLDRIVRQGRAFGIHVLLGSQTLGGAYTLARATIGQMVVRVALQCNEADAYLIMNEDNPAPRLLSRPGEAIYNDTGGSIEGNSPFQVVWLPDQERDKWLAKLHEFAGRKQMMDREPIVFEGNAPANVRDNAVLRSALEAHPAKPPAAARAWLGAPNSIKGPTEAVFRRQSGSHLLIVGQREEAALGMLAISLVSLAAQYPKDSARFFVFDCSAPDSAEAKFLERLPKSVPHDARLIRPVEVDTALSELAADQQRRTDEPGSAAPETYLLIHGLQRNKKLRFDEEMSFSLDESAAANPGLLLNKLICEGASVGFHVIATCDTYNNVMRFLSRKALSEFEMRVVFQMSANDSASLIDSPLANNLGLHRAILFNGHEGWLETFRPYALPDERWVEEVGNKLPS
ncbi:MAG: ATP-binding protein [Verrucomicrobia bacterium]|nr:ATP-binding protein [Verrucomicrobiota bacterium]